MCSSDLFLRLRNRLLPVVSLRNLLQLGDQPDETMGRGFIVVTQVGNHTFGMLVDRVFDTEEIVVKPVAPILRDLKMFSGNTILGDGSVIMILDPTGIADSSGISSLDSSLIPTPTTVPNTMFLRMSAARAVLRNARWFCTSALHASRICRYVIVFPTSACSRNLKIGRAHV